jgi:hypothetical protein
VAEPGGPRPDQAHRRTFPCVGKPVRRIVDTVGGRTYCVRRPDQPTQDSRTGSSAGQPRDLVADLERLKEESFRPTRQIPSPTPSRQVHILRSAGGQRPREASGTPRCHGEGGRGPCADSGRPSSGRSGCRRLGGPAGRGRWTSAARPPPAGKVPRPPPASCAATRTARLLEGESTALQVTNQARSSALVPIIVSP